MDLAPRHCYYYEIQMSLDGYSQCPWLELFSDSSGSPCLFLLQALTPPLSSFPGPTQLVYKGAAYSDMKTVSKGTAYSDGRGAQQYRWSSGGVRVFDLFTGWVLWEEVTIYEEVTPLCNTLHSVAATNAQSGRREGGGEGGGGRPGWTFPSLNKRVLLGNVIAAILTHITSCLASY